MATETPHPPCPLAEKLGESPSSEDLYDTMFIVKVGRGPAVKEFHVHKGLLCHYSKYFRGALKGGFQEREGIVALDQGSRGVFQIFVTWIYTKKLLTRGKTFNLRDGGDALLLCKIYVFADSRGVPMLKNAVTDLLITSICEHNVVPQTEVKYVYANTPEKDRFRALFVDIFSRLNSLSSTVFFGDVARDMYPPEFLFDLCKATVGKENAKKPDMSLSDWEKCNKCDYHDHTDINAPREPKDKTEPKKE
ncbi:hypothetical protein BLS_000292 [Venturia inaequalis]|uniref:BTB domain-containing protein n=1 Tax=Venturia inaequalis TaxID=5025 RepID=A0A8H3YJA1_VENIN|nr:hypothetical protein BLS_000292 [Venturia inaequalis]RDI82780.1 hypothetical protein Vi05172_g7206 [Venturia inaequalis]